MNKYFIFHEKVSAAADPKMNNSTVKRLWNSFCLTNSELEIKAGERFTFRLGDTSFPVLKENKEYALCVNENGAAIVGKDYGGLMRGFLSLLMKIEYDDENFKIGTITEESNYRIKNRMIHICVFPENDLYFIKKLIRLAGLCQYTHIIIEFWGMLQYDCLKELAWEHAFTKEQAKELIQEARQLGIEPVPMFNMLGHATASRVCYGKHVVLDQNPRLQSLFTPDGWAWNIRSDKVLQLFQNIRQELYELFGETEYIHIGCDEAYFYTHHDTERAALPRFLAKLTNAVVREGKRPMLWMDMILEREKFPPHYAAFGKVGESDRLLSALAKETVMVDWQYNETHAPFETSVYLKDKSLDLIVAPWLNPENYAAGIETISENDLFGILLTTWHTLKTQMPGILGCAKKCGAVTFPWSEFGGSPEETATLLRRVSFEGNAYADCGWSKEQIEV